MRHHIYLCHALRKIAVKKTSKPSSSSPCPCGNTAGYTACCGRWHHGALHLMEPDAPSLMRSRYTAFVLNELGYLLDTWHASTRPGKLEDNPPGLKWLGLELRGHTSHDRSEEHTSELQSLMRISYAVFCLKKKT